MNAIKKRPNTKQKRSKKSHCHEVEMLEDIPNVGPAIASYLRRIAISLPDELAGRDPYVMYDDLCRITNKRHCACLLDTFISIVRFMDGETTKPWWKYTKERKQELAQRSP